MKLQPPSQVLRRNIEALSAKRMLVIDSPGGEIAAELVEHHPDACITLMQTNYADYRRAMERASRWANERVAAEFWAWCDKPEKPYDLVVIYLPKSKAALELTVDMAANVLAPTGRVLLVGAVRGGIRSSKPALQQRFGAVEKLDVARRCTLWSATQPKPIGAESTLANWGTTWTCEFGDHSFEMFSYPGVFSHGRLDDGTKMLLETLEQSGPKKSPRRVLDFACGCGVIGVGAHALWPDAEIEMVDCSALALSAARQSAEAAGLSAGCVHPSDILSDVQNRYNLILSNPPFHAGIRTDYAVVQGFLTSAAEHLVYGGSLRLVANRFHKYKSLMQEYVGPCNSIAEDSRFRVYEAIREE